MKRFLVLCTSILCLLTLQYSYAARSEALDGIVAVVNQRIITKSELDKQLHLIKQQLSQSGASLPSDAELRHQVLQQLIYKDLQMQLVDRQNITIDPLRITKTISNIAKGNHMSLKQFKAELVQRGLTYKEFEKNVAEQLQIVKLQQEVIAPTIHISDAEIRAAQKEISQHQDANLEYHVKDILIPLPEVPSTQQVQRAKQKAKALVQKLDSGSNFEKIAIASSAARNALKGGDLGWRHLAELPEVFAAHIMNMKKGTIVGPIRTGNGFHIIKLVAVRGSKSSHQPSAAAQYKQARMLLYRRKFEQQLQLWLQKLRAGAYVKLYHA